jgi:hypothetical protein
MSGRDINGGAVFNVGNLSVSESVFTGNDSSQGGGISNSAGGTLAVTDSTFSGNTVQNSGGGIYNRGTATIARTTFSGNNGREGAGAYNDAAGTMTIINSTFAGNQATVGAAGLENNSTATLHVTNSTFFNNGGGSGFGAFNNINGTATFKGTLLARGPANANNCSISVGTVSSSGYNLSDDASCGTVGLNNATDMNNTPAGLDGAGLQDNGGPTRTIALLSTSAAIDKIPGPCTDVDGGALSTDQRGVGRPVGNGCDIGAFESPQPAPSISSFTPTSGPVGASVTITGTSFTNATDVKFNGTSATFTADSDTQITATVPTGATSGTLSVTGPGGTGTSGSSFIVAPAISSFTPTSGPVGTSVTITGANFTGASSVTFNGTSATFTFDSATQITATVPTGATTGPIAVTTTAGTGTSASNFTVTVGPAPTITSFSPDNGGVGTAVTINGTNFGGATSVGFGGASTTQFTVANNSKKITVNVPSGAATGPITVTTPGGTATSATNFTIVNQAPTISSFTPTSGNAGTQVQITGDNFIGVTSVMFGGKNAKFTVVDSTQINAIVPSINFPKTAGGGKVQISVTNPIGTANTGINTFTVIK